MNITLETSEDLTTLIKVVVNEEDYSTAVEKTLRDYRKKANIPGFRSGMTPMGIINKMYKKGVVAEESYRMASQGCFDHLESNNLSYVGDILPSDEQKELDFDHATEFEYFFEVGLAPEVKVELSNKDKITRYKIGADKKMYDGYYTNFLRRFGRLEEVDVVVKEEALGVTLDSDQIKVDDAYVGLISMDDKQRKPFIGKRVGDVMSVDINELYPEPSQRAAILKLEEGELDGIDPKFTLTIERIRTFKNPDMNEELFKMAFPKGDVVDEKGLKSHIESQIEGELSRESDYMYAFELRKMLIEKAAMTMPEAFLRRWLYTINEGKFTMEQIDKDFPQFLEMMKWSLVQKYFIDEFKLEVTEQEAMEEAKNMARQQFAQYGMAEVEDMMLENYAGQMLSNREEQRKVYDNLFEAKIVEAVSPKIEVVEKSVTAEQFGEIAETLMK